jgi:hydroxyacylglutathione hydrolase
MLIERIFTPGLAQVAYLVADEAARKVAVIDPRRDVDAYISWADSRNMEIAAILETHVHADFVSGAPELAMSTGAPIYASRLGAEEFPHEPLDDGDEVAIGAVILRALWTPGHTPEHMSFLATDSSQGDDPVAIFTGDALFVGEVGRPDLLGEKETQRLAEHLYETVSDRFSNLDDSLVVYPGHTAGSSCGKKIGDAPTTTIGQERKDNYAFQIEDEEAFIDTVLEGMPKPPTYYPVLKKVNKAGAVPLEELPAGNPFTPDEVARRQEAGALVVDARSPESFADGHIPGSVFAGLGPNFTTWIGWLAPYDREIILVLDELEGTLQFDEARTELHRIGVDGVAGYLEGGMPAWQSNGRDVVTLPQMTVQDLGHLIDSSTEELTVLDVRSDEEWQEGHIAGAAHKFAGEIAQGDEPPVDEDSPVALICGSGYRSSVVSSVLQQRGYRNLINVTGGMGAWNAASLPTILDN